MTVRRSASILTAVAILLMAYAPVYAAGQAAEDHLCCLQQLRQADEHAHCAGMAMADESPAPSAAQLHAAKHSCDRCAAVTSIQSVPLAATGMGAVEFPEFAQASPAPVAGSSSLDRFTLSERGPPASASL